MTDLAPIVLFTGIQRLARQLGRGGYGVACLREPGEPILSPEDVALWIPYNPADLGALGTWARTWPLRERVAAVLNRRERRVMEHALLNEAFRRPGIRPHQARILRDKLLLREAMVRSRIPLNPPFQKADLSSPETPTIPTPFLLKPRNLFKSQLITACLAPEEWQAARRRLLRGVEAAGTRHGVSLDAIFVAEAYLSGQEFSMDAFVGPDGGILFTPAVSLTPATKWGMDDFHVAVRQLPSRLGRLEEEALREAVREVVELLALRSTPLHVDLVVVDGKAVILDVAPRIGGYRSEMMELAFGVPLDPLSLDLAMERDIQWRPQWTRSVAVVELFPPERGRLLAIHGLEEMQALRSFRRARQRVPFGGDVGWARDGFRCPLFVVLSHQDPAVVEEEIRRLPKMIQMEVTPP